MHATLTLVHDAHEMLDFVDHAADCRRVLQHPPPTQLVEPKPL
jgi:hypothetical protein